MEVEGGEGCGGWLLKRRGFSLADRIGRLCVVESRRANTFGMRGEGLSG